MKKRFTTLAMTLVLCTGIFTGAYAASNNETISAMLNRDITINYNGVQQSFTDSNGSRLYPISYNGSTYLPVRAISNLLGININWNGNTNTIDIGTAGATASTSLVTRSNSGGTKYNWIITDKSEFSVSGSDANQEYTSGVQFDVWNGSASAGKERGVYFDCSGYSEVSFAAWADIDVKAYVYDQDYKVVSSFDLKAGQISSKTISLNGAQKICFQADASKPGAKGTFKVFDPTLK